MPSRLCARQRCFLPSRWWVRRRYRPPIGKLSESPPGLRRLRTPGTWSARGRSARNAGRTRHAPHRRRPPGLSHSRVVAKRGTQARLGAGRSDLVERTDDLLLDVQHGIVLGVIVRCEGTSLATTFDGCPAVSAASVRRTRVSRSGSRPRASTRYRGVRSPVRGDDPGGLPGVHVARSALAERVAAHVRVRASNRRRPHLECHRAPSSWP